ncbi:Carboxypeptidase B [Bagarius yarrelli]|uniref:Carboxypeptidase B n=1 Tax=Bagarius yarrelli TaxID=175774 RepID=A0A556VBF2_BAGYA|nr:Carboxypeptidase B [Bagarius yarrelli]
MMKALLILGLVAVALCKPSHYVGDKVFRLFPVSETQVSFIKELAISVKGDFWMPDSAGLVKVFSNVDIRIPAAHVDMVIVMLQQSNIDFNVLIDNLESAIRQQFDNNQHTKAHSYIKYNSWTDIEAWVSSITSSNSALISRSSIGKTFEGRNMHLLKIGKNTGSTKPAIFMDCGFHAREWISPAFCQWFVQEAASTYGSDPQMTSLLNEMDVFVLPVFNVDGYEHSWKSDRMWRKTRSRKTGSSCIGADPNRNFAAGWCNQAFVTLATNDKYAKGAIVLGKSLRNHKTSKKLVVLIGPHVTEPPRAVLQSLYDEVRLVDVLDSGDTAHLAMMQRPDLGVTITKLHCWTLTQYSKCVFMDADTMAVANIDELFDREEFSAAPDPGWPDCFNSGVFVFSPSNETYGKLLQYCTEHGSFDGK